MHLNLDNAKILHLTNGEKSDIDYDIIHFPDGEVQLDIKDNLVNFKKRVVVVTKICNANDLFVLLQAQDILERLCIDFDVVITYLMTQRSDRLFSIGRPFSLNIVAKLLKGTSVYILEPHNFDAILRLMTCTDVDSLDYDSRVIKYEREAEERTTMILYPDAGAKDRYEPVFPNPSMYLVGEKVRDVSTGQITDYNIKMIDGSEITIPDSVKKIVIVDDLCDGGRTFIGAWQKLIEYTKPDVKICLDVVHAVQETGIRKVCEAFDEVIVTNSYADWSKLNIPNLTVNDVQDIKQFAW